MKRLLVLLVGLAVLGVTTLGGCKAEVGGGVEPTHSTSVSPLK